SARPMRGLHVWGRLGALSVLAAAGCDASPARPRPVLLTVADFEALLADPSAPESIVPDSRVRGGMKLSRIITRDAGGKPTLAPRSTLTEEYKSSYLTTEVWAG